MASADTAGNPGAVAEVNVLMLRLMLMSWLTLSQAIIDWLTLALQLDCRGLALHATASLTVAPDPSS